MDFLYANSRFEVFAQNVSTANYEGRGRLYLTLIKFVVEGKMSKIESNVAKGVSTNNL